MSEWDKAAQGYWEKYAKSLEHQLKCCRKGHESLQRAINRKHQQLLDARVERDDAIKRLRKALWES